MREGSIHRGSRTGFYHRCGALLLSAWIVLAAGCGDRSDDVDYGYLHAAGLIDLDGDSNNDNGFNLPDRSPAEDSIEDNPGVRSQTVVVPLSSSVDHAAGAECFVPLVLELAPEVDISLATIDISYGSTDGGDGSVRLWLKPGKEDRSRDEVNSGGDLLPASGTYTCESLGFAPDRRTVVLYAEGITTSSEWGDVRVRVLLDPDGSGPADFAAADFIRLSVIDASWTVYLVLPYTFEVIDGVEKRTFAHLDFSSPSACVASFMDGLEKDDPLSVDDGWHGGFGTGFLSANIYGHSFTHLRYTGPGGSIDNYYGKTDSSTDIAGSLKAISELARGNAHWYSVQARRNGREELLQWVNNEHAISSVRGGPADLPLVLSHKWAVASLRAIDRLYQLSEPKSAANPDGTDYERFGLDLDATGGGCTYLSGAVMERVARDLGGFEEHAAWRSSLIWPVIPVAVASPREVAASYDASPYSCSWGQVEIPGLYKRVTYFDCSLMGDWMLANPGDSVYSPPAGQ